MQPSDCYRVLGLARNASWEDVKIAYRRLARKYHPDTNQADPLASDKFRRIQEAYQILRSVAEGETIEVKQNTPETPPPPQSKSPSNQVKVKVQPSKVPLSPEAKLLQDTLTKVQLLLRQRKYAVAIAMLEGLRQRFGDHSEVVKWLAVAYQRQGNELIQAQKYREAERYLRKALATAPDNRALCFEVQHDLDRLAKMI
ncbi:MAG: DnaJ domain-containing protein [Cyanobacteria bacterium KgW148]|nr:DnaJ domain-containing protein [Cyanobacteria bacterium KgW148]